MFRQKQFWSDPDILSRIAQEEKQLGFTVFEFELAGFGAEWLEKRMIETYGTRGEDMLDALRAYLGKAITLRMFFRRMVWHLANIYTVEAPSSLADSPNPYEPPHTALAAWGVIYSVFCVIVSDANDMRRYAAMLTKLRQVGILL